MEWFRKEDLFKVTSDEVLVRKIISKVHRKSFGFEIRSIDTTRTNSFVYCKKYNLQDFLDLLNYHLENPGNYKGTPSFLNWREMKKIILKLKEL